MFPVMRPVGAEGALPPGDRHSGTPGRLLGVPRGVLRIYIAAAAGAGATYAMLDEGVRRRSRGTRVAVACASPYGRPATEAMLASLTGTDHPVPEWPDTAALIDAHPDVVLVDELGSTNPSGSPVRYRWEDAEALLNAGIDVVATMTVQDIESLQDPVARITGRAPAATVPDEFLERADQVELIDIAPEAIRRRIAHGNVFAPDTDPTQSELFNSEAFAQLRLLLLQWMADRLAPQTARPSGNPEVIERVVVALSGAPTGDAVVRRAARLARRSRATLLGVHVQVPGAHTPAPLLQHVRDLVTDVGGIYREIEGRDVAAALAEFAEVEGATQLVLGAPGPRRRRRPRTSVADRVIQRSRSVDVHIVSSEDEGTGRRPHWRLNSEAFSRQRRVLALVIGAIVLAALTALFVAVRDETDVSTALGVYLLAVVGIASLGGAVPGVLAAIAAPLLANWFLIEPYHTLRIDDPENVAELAVFVSVALIVSTFVSVAARRANEADRARREAANLARLAGSTGPDALQALTDQLRQAFEFEGVSVLDTTNGTESVVVSSGANAPRSVARADLIEPIAPGTTVAARGRALTVDEDRVLRVFLGQLAKTIEQHRVASLAAEADALARADELRTGILRAVSHDLRTPLASIKASASSLRQSDVDWPAEVRDDFLASIEEETDRLTTIVSNLLDMSRLQAGAVRPALRRVSLEEVLPATVLALGARRSLVDLAIPHDLPDVLVDPALLDRVLANLLGNALEFAPPATRVRVHAHASGNQVHLYIVDHGPGIRPRDRTTVLQPFHRLSDSTSNSGVGLGLAIAEGLTEAMGGALELRDTPGGGLTALVLLPAADGPAETAAPPGPIAGDSEP